MAKKLKVIADRRDKKIKNKEWIWTLISDSYAGGTQYRDSGYLMQYPREPAVEYKARKERAVYLNNVQPIADVIAGFLFAETPTRKFPQTIKYIGKQTSKKKGIDSFMMTVALHSLLHTCGVLVDAPEFDENEVKTRKDRDEAGLNPYAVLYMPWQVRDYAADDQGDLLWVLLDNTYMEKDDPLAAAEEMKVYRLWTRDDYSDFRIKTDGSEEDMVTLVKQEDHDLGVVPFRFVNWRDKDEDFITETPFEDIAMLDRQIYNTLSYLDEMLAGGTFKILFFPVKGPKDLEPVKAEGIGQLSIVPFPHDAQKSPYFAGAKLEEIGAFISAIEFYLKGIFRKMGLDKDEDQKYVQSGAAKSKEFQKCEALLRVGAENLEETEKFIFETAMRWEGTTPKEGDVKSKYAKKFQSEELDAELSRLYEALALPIKALKKLIIEEIVPRVLPELDQKRREELMAAVNKEMDSEPVAVKTDTDDLARAEEEARKKEGTPDGEGETKQ